MSINMGLDQDETNHVSQRMPFDAERNLKMNRLANLSMQPESIEQSTRFALQISDDDSSLSMLDDETDDGSLLDETNHVSQRMPSDAERDLKMNLRVSLPQKAYPQEDDPLASWFNYWVSNGTFSDDERIIESEYLFDEDDLEMNCTSLPVCEQFISGDSLSSEHEEDDDLMVGRVYAASP